MKTDVSLSPFVGMITNADPSDLPRGAAQLQENLQSLKAGQLSGRGGNQKAAFLNGQSAGTSDVIAVYNCHRPAGDCLLFETADGALRVGRGPSVMAVTETTVTGAPTIKTGLNAATRLCMTKDRKHNVYGVNGLDRGIRWDTMTSAVEQLGITAPVDAPTVVVSGAGGSEEGDYYCAYRYFDDTLPTPNYSSLSADTIVTAALGQGFVWSGLSVPTEARVSGVEILRGAVGPAAQNKRYSIARLTLAEAALGYTDTFSDNALILAAAAAPETSVFINYPNGQLCGRRFEPPPDFKKVMFMHQDRAYYCADAVYSVGTASTTSGSREITGSDTTWTEAFVGRYFYNNSESAPLVIEAYISATHLRATTAATASAAFQTYSIRPDPAYRNSVFYSEQDEPESVPISQNVVTVQQSGGNDEDEMVGGMPFGSVAYLLFDRHIYTLSSYQQPVLDANVTLLANRGALCQRCWDIFEGMAYLMDASGPYSMTPGGAINPIGGAIQNYFRDNMDFSKKETFHVTCDPILEIVRFFVVLRTDTVSRPKRALAYHLRTKGWWLETYHCQFGDSGRTEIGSKLRAIAGGEDEAIYFMGEGNTDVVPTQYRGTATAGTATTLTDSAAAFGAEVVGAPVAIVSGTGKGQVAIVTARTATQLTVASWPTATPDTTSVYLLGAVEYEYLSAQLAVNDSEEWHLAGAEVSFAPTASAALMDVRRYWNHDTTADPNAVDSGVPQTLFPIVTTKAGDPSHVIDLRRNRGSGESGGVAFCPFSGRRNERFEARRELTLQFKGFQGDDQIVIYDAQVLGAK